MDQSVNYNTDPSSAPAYAGALLVSPPSGGESYLAYRTHVVSDDGCLVVDGDKIKLRKCDKGSENQKFNYVIADKGKTYFKTFDGRCLDVDDVNYVNAVKCKNKALNWKLMKNGFIKKFGSDDTCFTKDYKGDVVAGACKYKFDMDFTSFGKEYCQTRNGQLGCGKYGDFMQGLVSDVYGAQPRAGGTVSTFNLDCPKSNIEILKIHNKTNNIGVACRGDNRIKWAFPLSEIKYDNDYRIFKDDNYHHDDLTTFKTNYGFGGAMVQSSSYGFKRLVPYGMDVPFPKENSQIGDMEIFTCPNNQVMTQISGTKNNDNIKSIQMTCKAANRLTKDGDPVFDNMYEIMGKEFSRYVHYKEITTVEDYQNINEQLSLAHLGGDTIVLLKIIPTRLNNKMYINERKCTMTEQQFIKPQNYKNIEKLLRVLVSRFDKYYEVLNVSDLKENVIIPRFLALNKVDSPIGYLMLCTNSKKNIIYPFQLIKDLIETNKPAYVIVYDASVCFKNSPEKPNPDFPRASQGAITDNYKMVKGNNKLFDDTIVEGFSDSSSSGAFLASLSSRSDSSSHSLLASLSSRSETNYLYGGLLFFVLLYLITCD